MSRLVNAEAQAIAELAAVLAEGARLSRGRQYQRRAKVTDVFVEAGLVSAAVHGSLPDPYEVTIACKTATENERAATELDPAAAVPKALDIAFTCHCPDWGDPCKHGVAALLEFAREVDDDPSLLLRWRGLEDMTPPPPIGTESWHQPEAGPSPGPTSDVAPSTSVEAAEPAEPAIEPEPEPADDGLAAFFGESMPDGPLVGPIGLAQLDAYAGVRIEIETVDIAPALSGAIDAIADHWLSL